VSAAIFWLIIQDALSSAAIYILIAVGVIVVFSSTRIVLFFQGELIAFSALTFIALSAGEVPGSIYILLAVSALSFVSEVYRHGRRRGPLHVAKAAAVDLAYPAILYLMVSNLPFGEFGKIAAAIMTMAIIAPVGPAIYRVAFRPAANASILTLLMISMGCHMILVGMGLYAFGSDGARAQPLIAGGFRLGAVMISYDDLVVIGVTIAVVAALWGFFRFTRTGKALKAAAVNRVGAQLVGIRVFHAGQIAFFLAALIGAIAGILLASSATIYYDSGFVVALKGFVASVLAGLAFYPLAGAAAVFVAIVESFSSFWASAFREVIVLTVLFPALIWLSLSHQHEDDDHE